MISGNRVIAQQQIKLISLLYDTVTCFSPYIVMFYRNIGASRWRIANSFSFRLKPTDEAGLSSATIWDMAIGNQN
jgi:hypothetical protein